MNSDLMERYIYAVTRRLPHRVRGDIGAELRGLVEDMLEERCGEVPPQEADLRAVLEGLGPPARLAEQYNPDGATALIGPPYYSSYKMVLGIVLASVAFGLTIAALVGLFTGPSTPGDFFLGWLGNLFGGLAMAFAFVTLLYAVLQRLHVRTDELNQVLDELRPGLDDLPEVPVKREEISYGGAIFSIVFSVVFTVVFLVVPDLIYSFDFEAGVRIPVFNAEHLAAFWPAIVGMGLLGVAEGVAELVEGRYTKRLAVFEAACNLFSAVFAALLFSGRGVLNPAFLRYAGRVLGDDLGAPMQFLENANLFLLGIILFALVLDTATTFYSAFRAKRA